jgi:AsmA protein
MSGILENPDAAYAKLKEMGKGLFGPGGAGLGGLLSGLGGSGAATGGSTGTAPGSTAPGSASDPLGGKLGETLGNLLQQGLGGLSQGSGQGGPGQSGSAQSGRSQGRSLVPAPGSETAAPPPPPAQNDIPQATPDSQAMNEVLRQLFNR